MCSIAPFDRIGRQPAPDGSCRCRSLPASRFEERRRRLVVLLAASLALLAAPGVAGAWDISFRGRELVLSATETFKYTYHRDNANSAVVDDGLHQFLNVLDVSLSQGDYRLGARFDLNLFAGTAFGRSDPLTGLPYCEGESPAAHWCAQREVRYRNQLAVERLYFIVARRELDLTLGDFYASFGKGIALNVVKIDELGQDSAIRGGKLVVHHRDFGLTLLGGEINTLDVDEATGLRAPWSPEPILAGRIEYRFFDALIVGAHAVHVLSDCGPYCDNRSAKGAPTLRRDYHIVAGGSVEAPDLLDGRLSLAADVDVQHTVEDGRITRGPGREAPSGVEEQEAGRGPSGFAAYGAVTLQLADLTLLGEYKHYNDFVLKAPRSTYVPYPFEPYELYYHQPPTLERVTAQIANNIHVTGGRVRADYNFGELGAIELLVFANYGYFESWANERSFFSAGDEHTVHDAHGGLELSWMSNRGRLALSAGLRRELNLTADTIYQRDIHLDASVEQALSTSHSLKLHLVWLGRERPGLGTMHEWNEVEMALSYKWSPHLAVAFTYERQEDLLVDSTRRNFFGGSVQYFFNPGTHVSVRVGENRPGLKCISGTCRNFPAFSGVQVMLVGRI